MATEMQNPTNEEQFPNETLVTPSLTVDPTNKVEESMDTTATTTEAVLASSTPESGSSTDIQKRIRRAERFGVPVQLSEKEKMNSRAERFGTASISHGSDELKKLEEQKRKARAERFGLPVQSVADEEAKKKARLARFAPASKISAVDEDKMKARAARFSQTTSSLEGNGKTNSEKETSKVGKASVGT